MSAPTTARGLLWSTGDAQDGVDVVSGTNWTPGDWVLVLADAPAGTTVVTITTSNLPVISGIDNLEGIVEMGWGVTDANVCLVTGWPFSIGHPAPSVWDLAMPIPRLVPTGSNIYLRYATADVVDIITLPNVAIGYYIDYDSTHETDLSFYREPDDNDGTQIDFEAVSWDWSDWVEVSAGPISDAYFAGLSIVASDSANPYTDAEFEIGTGAGPTSIGTIPVVANGLGSLMVAWLPRVVPVAEGVPISVRVRTVAPLIDGVLVAPLYYADPPADCGTSIVVIKDNEVTGDTTSFSFGTNGGLLTPDSFELADGESMTFLVTAGDGYSIQENVPENWVVTYTVSNGSPITNITVEPGEVVIVTAHNVFNPPSILYADRRLRQFALPTDENKWVFIHRLEIELQRGEGLSEGQGSDPQVMLSLSRDGGKTWGPEMWTSAGRQGDYECRAIWRRLGRARNPVVRIVVSDPIFWSFQACYLEAEPGTS